MEYKLGKTPRITCKGQCRISIVSFQLGPSSICNKQGNRNHLRDGQGKPGQSWLLLQLFARGGKGDMGLKGDAGNTWLGGFRGLGKEHLRVTTRRLNQKPIPLSLLKVIQTE